MAKENETIIGMQFDDECAQITWFTRGMRDPVTAGIGQAKGSELYEVPDGVWAQAVSPEGPVDALSAFFAKCLEDALGQLDYASVRIMVTLPRLQNQFWDRVPAALVLLGVERKNIFLQDNASSFYYYTVNKKKELWSADVALLEYRHQTMIGSILHIDRTKSPALVTVEETARGMIDESRRAGRDDTAWNQEKDRQLFEFLKKVFERRNVVTVYLMSDYFDRSWAERSFQYLCFRRHAFQGKNLFSKGACYAAMDRIGWIRIPGMLFVGENVVSSNLTMPLRVRGRETPYPLIVAGVNWYEAHHECEIIPDGENRITVYSKPMNGGPETAHVLRLEHMPRRPNRATRLRLNVYFTSPDKCVLEAEDLGFGGLYRSSGRRWKRTIYL